MALRTQRVVALLLVAILTLSVAPGLAAAESRAGGTVVVEADETTGDLEVFAGDVVVRGTVDGDLTAIGGNVRIEGTVTGNVEGTAGNIYVGGTVGGDVSGAAGHVQVAEGGSIEGTLEVGAGSVLIAGSIGGDARIGAESITLAPGASVGGDLEYDGTLDRQEGAQVGGAVTENPDLAVGPGAFFQVADALFSVYFVLVNLLVGAILLLAFPRFSDGLVERTRERPGVTGVVGLGTLVAAPIVLVLVAITIVGIPLSLLGFLSYAVGIWLAIIYGRYLLGAWLLSLVDRENRWLALLVGVLAMVVLTRVPIVGGLADVAVLVWGLGALVLGLFGAYRRGRGGEADSAAPDEPAPA